MLNAFLNLYAGIDVSYADLADEFDFLAEKTLTFSVEGFMHRDFQSRNIMLSAGTPYFIDFQGGRMGPLQYDLASLLIDPYAALSQDVQDLLLEYYMMNCPVKAPGSGPILQRLCLLCPHPQPADSRGFRASFQKKGQSIF